MTRKGTHLNLSELNSSNTVSQLSTLISQNVNNRGMTSKILNKLCQILCPNNYVGLYTPLNIPFKKLQKMKSFTIIVFLSPNKGLYRYGHYITIHANSSTITYIDPFGLPCFDKNIQKLLYMYCKKSKKNRRNVLINNKQIQNEKSVYCGLYAVLFSLYFDLPTQTKKIKLYFKSKGSLANDKLCVTYLNKLMQ